MAVLRHLLLSFIALTACSGSARLDLADLTLVDHFPMSGGAAYRIVLGDHVAFVSDESGFQSFRLTDTTATPLATFVFEPQSSQTNQPLALRGNLLAVAHGARISLVDVADPANPHTLSTIIAGSDGTAHALAFDGDYVYWGGINLHRASIVDPQNPGVPQVIAAQPFDSIVIKDGYIYASGPGSVVVFTLPDPAIENAAAVPIGMASSLPEATTLVLNGTALYGAAGSAGNFFVVDVANPKAPKVIDADAAGFTMGGALVLQGDQLLAPATNGVTYDYDVSDPLHPVGVNSRVVARGYDNVANFGAARRGDLLLLASDGGLLVLYPTLR